jgi:hypothetical protein
MPPSTPIIFVPRVEMSSGCSTLIGALNISTNSADTAQYAANGRPEAWLN